MSKHRLFIALPISPTLKGKIFDWSRKYNTLPVRWISRKNLHLTIIPPWYENSPEKIKKILQKFSKKNKGKPLHLNFESITYGPNQSSPRLIWASGQHSSEVNDFKNNLENFLKEQDISIKEEKRLFRPHLTLARFKPEYFSEFPIKKIDDKISWKTKISKFVLMESHLSKSGADYEILQTHRL